MASTSMTAYYSSNNAIYSVPVNPFNGRAIGPVRNIAPDATDVDDFVITPDGDIYAALNTANELANIRALPGYHGSYGPVEVVAGDGTLKQLAGPSSVRIGRTIEDIQRGSLYIGTTDGVPEWTGGNWTVGGGGVRRIDVGGWI